MKEEIQVAPVEIASFTLEDATDILKRQNPGTVPQWQFHGGPLVVGNEIRQVMVKLDRVRPPDIITPAGGPLLVR